MLRNWPAHRCAVLLVLVLGGFPGGAQALEAPNDISAEAVPVGLVPFEEPLLRASPTTAEQDHALALALGRFRQEGGEDSQALEEYVRLHPASGWNLALLTNAGLQHYRAGFFSRALEAFERAWQIGKPHTEPRARALADRALGELMLMHARLGHADALSALLRETESRPLSGAATELRTAAREGLWSMRHAPGISFLCGPLALKNLLQAQGAEAWKLRGIEAYRSGPRGVALSEVEALARQAGLEPETIHRKAGQPIPVPSIIHWKVAHYAAIVEENGGRYRIQDPTFGEDLLVSRAAIEAEASGYFLIEKRALKPAWRPVPLAEAARVRGMGNTGNYVMAGATKPTDLKAKASSCPDHPGLCDYNFHTMLASLNLTDTPVGYRPPIGPPVYVTLTYNQREVGQPANFPYFNVSQKWTLNWLSFIEDNPAVPGANVVRRVAGGGGVHSSGYDPATGHFQRDPDDASRLVRLSDQPIVYERRLSDGSVERYSHALAGSSFRRVFLQQVKDPVGHAVTLHYDDQARLISLTDATGRDTVFRYESVDFPLAITRIIDPFGRSAILEYDGQGRLMAITDVLGLTASFHYNASSLIDRLTTPYGTTTFVMGESPTGLRFVEATDPLGQKERVEFRQGAPGMASSAPSAQVPTGMPTRNAFLNYRNSFYWDPHAYAQGAGDYNQARIQHWHHLTGATPSATANSVESSQAPLENRIWYSYPGQASPAASGTLNRPTSIGRVLDDGTTQLRQFSYNPFGKITRSIDPQGRETLYDYAANDLDLIRIRQKTSATATATLAEFTYDERHRPLTYTDAAGEVTRYAYNVAGQLSERTDALGQTIRFTYDPLGYLTAILDPNGDLALRLTYDAYGRVRTRTDSEDHTLEYQYDDLDRITQITYPDGTARTFTWDKLDLASITDRAGRETQYLYDAVRNRIATVDSNGQTTRYGYYGNHTLQSLTDPNGNTTTWRRDLQSRLTAKRYADGQGVDYVYEKTTSRLKSRTDALGQTTHYRYARDDALTDISYANAVQATTDRHFRYDPFYPRLISFENGEGRSAWQYVPEGLPGAGRIAEEITPEGYRIERDYDRLGRLAGETLVDADNEPYPERLEYDALDRVVAKATGLGRFRYAYAGASLRLAEVSYPNRTVSRFTYFDPLADLRLKSLDHRDAFGHLLAGYDYRYDAEGRIVAWQRRGFEQAAEAYLYDPLGQLVEVTATEPTPGRRAIPAVPATPGGRGQRAVPATPAVPPKKQRTGLPIYTYAYDAAGNRVLETIGGQSSTAIYNALNQLVTQGEEDYRHDPEGNRSERTSVRLGDRRYLWDAENRLIGIEDPNDPATRSDFRYDALGRRIALRDTEHGILTRDRRLLYCSMTLCGSDEQTTGRFARYYAEGEFTLGEARYHHHDHLGSVRLVTDPGGTLTAAYGYDPYGRRTVLQGAPDDSPFGYTGHALHPATGLALAAFRAYDPETGRWLSRDPIGEAGGVHLYGYVGNSPVNFTDSSGLIVDTLADLGFLLYDLYKLGSEGACERNANLTALGLDILGAITPGATGLGAAARITKRAPKPGDKVYRVWGDGAGPNGRSWSRTDPRTVENYRDAAGLPDQNSGRFVTEGTLTNIKGITQREALPLHGNKGGLDELVVPDPAKQIRLDHVSGVNPEF